MTSPLSIAELALSFSANTCFGLMSSKWGTQNSGKLGAGSIAFGLASLLLGVIGQAQQKQPPPALTKADLKQATDALRAQISDDRFQDEVIGKLAPLQVLATQVDTALTRAMAAVKSDNRFDPELDDLLNKDWASYYASFKKVDGYQQDCLVTAQWVADYDNRKFDTMDLYQLAASLYLNINQICLMVEWNAILNDPSQGTTWRKAYVDFRHAYKAYKKDHAKWLKEQQEVIGENWDKYSPGGPGSGNPGIYWGASGGISNAATYVGNLRDEPKPPLPPPATPDTYSDLQTSIFANNIKDNVSAFIKYADPVVTQMENQLARHEQIMSLTDATKAHEEPFKQTALDGAWQQTHNDQNDMRPQYSFPDAFCAQVRNSTTGECWTRSLGQLAERQVDILKGIELAGLMDDPLVAVHHLTRKQVTDFRKTIDNWKETEKNYAFAKAKA